MQYVEKFLKIVGKIVFGILVLSILLSLLIQLPAVQTYLVKKISNTLSEQLATEVRVGYVGISFFNQSKLKRIYLADQSGDTLFYANELKADVSILPLLSNTIEINRFSLEDAVVNLNRNPVDSTYNFDFLLDYFAPADTTTSTAQPWLFDFGTFSIINTTLDFDDPIAQLSMGAQIGTLNLSMKDLDLAQQIASIQSLQLENSKIRYVNQAPSAVSTPTVEVDVDAPVPFPYTGWDLSLSRLSLANNEIVFQTGNTPTIDGLDWTNLNVVDLNLEGRSIKWKDELIAASLRSLSLSDHSGFQIDQLQFIAQLDATGISAYDFLFETPTSRVSTDLEIAYPEWGKWMDLRAPVMLEVDFDQSNLSFKDIDYFTPMFGTVPIQNVQTEGIRIEGALTGNLDRLDIRKMDLAIDQVLDLAIDGQIQNLANPNQLSGNFRIEEAVTSYRRLQRILPAGTLPPELQQLGTFRLQAAVEGRIDSFRTRQFDLTTDTYTGFRGNARITNISNPERTRFNMDIIELKTRPADWIDLLPATATDMADSLGNIIYSGKLVGTYHDFNLAGDLQTSLGNLQSDLSIAFNSDYTSGDYSGELELQQFNLGALLDQSGTIGKVSLKAKGEGSGFTVDSLRAKVNAVIEEFTYLDYVYEDVKVDGQFRQRQFIGSTRINDPNAQFIFDGMLDLNDSLPVFDFVIMMDTVNFAQLNLMEDTLGVHANATLRGRGNSLDNLDGEINISSIRIANDSIAYQADSINIVANQRPDGIQELLIGADFLTAQFIGNYSLAKLPGAMVRYVNDFISMQPLVADSLIADSLRVADLGQQLEFQINLTDPTPLAFLPISNVPYLEAAGFSGNFNSAQEELKVNGWVSNLKMNGIKADSILLRGDGDGQALNLVVDAREISSSPSNRMPKVQVAAEISNQLLGVQLQARNDDDTLQLDLRGDLARWQDGYKLSFRPNFQLNESRWQIPESNAIYYQPGFLFVDDFALMSNNQEIKIQSQGAIDTTQSAPIVVGFNNFQLSEVSSLLNMEENFIDGSVNGRLKLVNVMEDPRFLSNLTVSELALNEEPLGELALNAEQQNQDIISLEAVLRGRFNDVEVSGTYPIRKGDMNIIADIDELEMRILDPFVSQLITDNQGSASGQIAIKGTLSKPDIKGQITLDSFQTRVVFLNTVYTLPKQTIEITDRVIDLGEGTIYDKHDHTATLSGRVRHNSFTNFRFNIDIESDQFLFLNTPEAGVNIFYGDLILDADISIFGTPELPVFDIRAKTLEGTDFYLLPLAINESVVLEEKYIIFDNPYTFTAEDSTRQVYELENAFGLEMFITLELTPDALLHIVVDPETGDQLDCRGNADMIIAATSTGAFTITGNYVITEGDYTFNYEKLVKKQFEIRAGSNMFFPGDPLNARFDVTAVYIANTTTYPLIQSETSLTEGEVREASRRSRIQLLLKISGKLENPQITFDLQLPENQNDLLDNAVARKFEELRSDPGELNKQAFGLLLFNNFIATESSGPGLANVGENVVLSSVSNLIANQLNNIASRFIKGIDVKLDVDSYKSQYIDAGAGGTVTEVNLGLSKQLFNDRLTLQAGGNLNIDNAAANSGSDFSNIAGDFLLEYKLTEDGTYRLQVFQRSRYDVFDDANNSRTGVGIFFQKSLK